MRSSLAVGTILLVVFPFMVHASEELEVDFKQDVCTSSSESAPPDINIKTEPPRSLNVEIESSFTCSTEAREPKVNLYANTMTVSVDTYSPSGEYGMCTCRSRMSFDITLAGESAELPDKLYFVQDSVVRGEIGIKPRKDES